VSSAFTPSSSWTRRVAARAAPQRVPSCLDAFFYGSTHVAVAVRKNNFFRTDQAISPDMFIERFNGTAIHATGTLVNGFLNRDRVDVVAAWNDVNDPDLLTDVGWVPTLFTRIDRTWTVPFLVEIHAGPFFWRLAAPD
jgi:hypothetical protein